MTCCTILTDATVGGTFLSWSWHWLKGDTQYYHVESNKQLAVTDNPLLKTNSHNFLPNQPENLNTFEEIFNDKQKQHIYFHNFRDQDETAQAIEAVKSSNNKTILVTKDSKYALYTCSLSRRSNATPSLIDHNKKLFNGKEILLDQLRFFFGADFDYWQQQNLTDLWDLREFIALNQRPLENHTIKNFHPFDFDYFDLPAVDVWKQLDKKIKPWFEYCEVSIDSARLQHWLNIYQQWQQLHRDRINFCENFDTIVNSILTNQNIDLEPFNLDIVREAAIQHTLIYQHNLNFKTWQLEKFENTKQLHNLLEPNIHHIKQ